MREKREWKPIPGFPGYEASPCGAVRSLIKSSRNADGSYILKQHLTGIGYPSVRIILNGKKIMKVVHQLVMLAYVGPRPKGFETGHRDGNKLNNNLSNLEYITPQVNSLDRVKHGKGPTGERSPTAKLTEQMVRDIKRRAILGSKKTSNTAALAKEFGVRQKQIYNIAAGINWSHVK